MADRDHPRTHVEDQDLDGPRKQPLSPQHSGIDPLTESDTMYPAENVKQAGEKLAREEAKADEGSGADKPAADNRTLEDHTNPDNQPSIEQPASPDNEPASPAKPTAAEQIAADTKPGQPDDTTPDKGEQALPQEPHTDKGNTSPANRTTRSKV